jgi:hypothetical protein
VIYFAVALNDATHGHFRYVKAGSIKIGTAKDVVRRVREFRGSYGVQAKLLATTPGSYPEERQIHRLLKASQIRPGVEWYRPSAEVLAHMKAAPAVVQTP